MRFSLSVCLCLLMTVSVNSSKILVLLGFSTHSHMNIFWPMIDGLQSRGHQVTVVSSHTEEERKHPGVKQIELKETKNLLEKFSEDMFDLMQRGLIEQTLEEREFLKQVTELYFNNSFMKKLLEEKPHYDLILTDVLENYYNIQVASYLKIPIVLVSTSYVDTYSAHTMGIPLPYSYVPCMMTSYTTRMSFIQRLSNSFCHLSFLAMFKYMELVSDSVTQKYLPGIPAVSELRNTIALLISNSDPVMDVPRPSLPNVVRVGPMHIQKPKSLPKDLEDFVASSGEEGFIILSLGSVIIGDKLPEATRKVFIKTFSEIKTKVIWKYEGEIQDIPNNVKLVKWLPQQSLLDHPKCRLFITHGGLLSMQESLYHEVPVIGVPVFAEQPLNCARAKDLGFGECIDVYTVSYDELYEKITKLLTVRSYKENAKKYSLILKDQPDSSTERAVYWLEYVIRHKGASHLQTPVNDLSLMQYFCLDIIVTVLFTTATVITIIIYTLRVLLRKICKCQKKQKQN